MIFPQIIIVLFGDEYTFIHTLFQLREEYFYYSGCHHRTPDYNVLAVLAQQWLRLDPSPDGLDWREPVISPPSFLRVNPLVYDPLSEDIFQANVIYGPGSLYWFGFSC